MINNKSPGPLSITYLPNLGLVFGGHFSFNELQSFLRFLLNMFGERLLSNQELQAEIVARMLRMKNVANKFATRSKTGPGIGKNCLSNPYLPMFFCIF